MKINDIITHLHTSGACKLYFPNDYRTNPKVQRGLEFKIGENRQLEISAILDVYDKPYWNGEKINEDATLKEAFQEVAYTQENMDIPISTFVYCTVMDTKSMVQTSKITTKPDVDDTQALNQFFQIVSSMLSTFDGFEATEKEMGNVKNPMFQCVKGGENSFGNIMVNSSRKQKTESTQLSFEEITEQLSAKHKDFSSKLFNAYRIWKLSQGFDSDSTKQK